MYYNSYPVEELIISLHELRSQTQHFIEQQESSKQS